MMKYTLYRNIGLLMTCEGAMKKQGRRIQEQDLSLAEGHSMVVGGGKICWIGPHRQLPRQFKSQKEIDCRDHQIYPGFVECHTHIGFAGRRADEFEQRLQGVSYQEINRRGGGIQSTMKQTRAMSAVNLQKITQIRTNHFVRQGITTLEAKSGYGLDLKTELKLLEVYSLLKGPRLIKTYLGPHSLPPEFSGHDEYIDFICSDILPKIAKKKLAERVDIFVEKGFFTPEQANRYFKVARALGFEAVVHADQLSLSGGSEVAIKHGALSADHVIQIGETEIHALSESEVTCVLLPLADFYMRCAYPKARQLIDAGARVAVATDFNPGSSPSQNVNLTGLLSRLEMKMSLPEVIGAYTVGAAYALNRNNLVGSLEVGKFADFVMTRKDWSELFYSTDAFEFDHVFVSGKKIYSALRNKI